MSVSQAVVLAFATALAILSGSSLNAENAQACLICMAVMGFLVIPTALEMAAELAFPFSSAVAAGALWAGADSAVIVIGVSTDIAFGGDGMATTRFADGGRWLLLACLAVAAALWWLFPVRCAQSPPPAPDSLSACLPSGMCTLLMLRAVSWSVCHAGMHGERRRVCSRRYRPCRRGGPPCSRRAGSGRRTAPDSGRPGRRATWRGP